jgi:hypothetical protein
MQWRVKALCEPWPIRRMVHEEGIVAAVARLDFEQPCTPRAKLRGALCRRPRTEGSSGREQMRREVPYVPALPCVVLLMMKDGEWAPIDVGVGLVGQEMRVHLQRTQCSTRHSEKCAQTCRVW